LLAVENEHSHDDKSNDEKSPPDVDDDDPKEGDHSNSDHSEDVLESNHDAYTASVADLRFFFSIR